MSRITTHVLDTAQGRPAAAVHVALELAETSGVFQLLAERITDEDGRVRDLLPESAPLVPGIYRLRFETGLYFAAAGVTPFHPLIEITFAVRDPGQHYHVPLLLTAHGYTTYRGS